MCILNTLLLFVLIQLHLVVGEDIVVQLSNGNILGLEAETIQNKSFYAFEKIPYASPPIGPLRFKAPQPPKNWDGILDNSGQVACYQIDPSIPVDPQAEDCLYLNVFTPQVANVSLPVMLYIHGGGFLNGASFQHPPDWFVDNDVILVTINYRLGIYGFLSTEDVVISGNNGLKDQQLAIQWTHENIRLFGGDPDKITIFGQSAWSASVAYQLLNQKSRDFFQSAILESGTFLSPWAFQRNPRDYAFDVASILNSTFLANDDSLFLLEFLQSVDAEVLNAAAEEFFEALVRSSDTDIGEKVPFAPVIEVKNPDAFLTRKMYQLLQAGNVVPVPVLMGMVSEEALILSQDPEALKNALQILDGHMDWLVPTDMQLSDVDEALEMGQQIREIYTGGELFADHLGDGIRFGSDTEFTRSIIKYAELYSKVAKTYFYQFSYHGTLGGNTQQYEDAGSVGHSEELRYLFCSGAGCDLGAFPKADQLVHERLIKLWTNFAKFGNPTPEKSELFQNITWPEVDTDQGEFLYLDIDENLEIKNHPKEETYKKWVELYDSLGRSDFDTY